MSGNYVENVSGREEAVAEKGNPAQKSWTILLERKIKAALYNNGHREVKVEKVQQPLNGQWLIVVNGSIIVHRPAKTVVSIYRADDVVNKETIVGAPCFTNLVDENKPSARCKNEGEMMKTLLTEVDRDLGLLAKEPVAEKVDDTADEETPETGKRSRLKRRVSASVARMAKAPVADEEDDESEVAPESKLKAGQRPDPLPFPPLLSFIDGAKQFVALDAMLVEAVDVNGQYVTWAVNVYVPVHEIVDNELKIVEHLHLMTLIDQHSRECSEDDLADSTMAPLLIRFDKEEMQSGSAKQTIEEFFDNRRMQSGLKPVDGAICFLQDDVGLPETSIDWFAHFDGVIQRQSVLVEQTCKHHMRAVQNSLARSSLKTVYFGKAISEQE